MTTAIRESNRDVGGRVVEMTETDYMARGRGYLHGRADIENLVVAAGRGTPLWIRDIVGVEFGPDERRGITELNGETEVASGIAISRDGQNALELIHSIKEKFAPGYCITWSGQFEYMERAKEKLKVVVPVTLLIIFLLLYLSFCRLTETLIVMLSVPFALVGGVWLMWLLNYNLSVAVAGNQFWTRGDVGR